MRGKEFIPGRPQKPRVARVFREITPGAINVSRRDYEVAIPASGKDEERISLSQEELEAHGIDTEKPHLTDPDSEEGRKLVEAAYRKQEQTAWASVSPEDIPSEPAPEPPPAEPAPDVIIIPPEALPDVGQLTPSEDPTPVVQDEYTYSRAWNDAGATVRGYRGGRMLYRAAVVGGVMGIAAGAMLAFVIGGIAGMWWVAGKFTSALEKLFGSGKHKKQHKDSPEHDHKDNTHDHKAGDHGHTKHH